jgi:hypothetical protein
MRIVARYESRLYWISFIEPNLVQVTYIFKKLLRSNYPGPGLIRLRDGDEIQFGKAKT